jgi:cytochrome c biogenesis protein CcdA/thiol-disulfide isomerase/thioredoxin
VLLLAVTFAAGALTALAPCVLPLLPVIVGGSVAAGTWRRALIVTGSLAASVVVFTLLLKATAALVAIPPATWTLLSAVLVGLVGLTFAVPAFWEKLPIASLAAKAQRGLGAGARMQGILGDIVTGAALGPVFSSCSPTYFLILAAVLPVSLGKGIAYLISYALGLSLVLLLIALLGQRFASKLGWLADPRGWLRRGLGVLIIVVAVGVGFGLDKKLQTELIKLPFFSTLERFEQSLIESTVDGAGEPAPANGDALLVPQGAYREIQNPSGFVNTNGQPFTLGEHVGKRVVLLDFMTYSCINCQRTFPHLVAWDERYRDSGLVVVGIHTPEFAFERLQENVERELAKFGITFPVVLDNDYATWRAYGNSYWPRKYLIDIDGNVVYDHIGEGAYDRTERAIRQALMQRAAKLGISGTLPAPVEQGVGDSEGAVRTAASPETYLGSSRSVGTLDYGTACRLGMSCSGLSVDDVALDAAWSQYPEFVELGAASGKIAVRFYGNALRIVAGAPGGATLQGSVDGRPVGPIAIGAETLYEVGDDLGAGSHLFEGTVSGQGAKIFTLTFSGPSPVTR